MQIVRKMVCHMSKYFGQKNRFFLIHFSRDHYGLLFYLLFHKLILLFFDSNLHKSQKNSRKWTSMMSKNRYVETFL